MNSQHCIDVCNSLLRGERSAVETYDLAISKICSSALLNEITRIRGEHADAVAKLIENVRFMGGLPDQKSGVWGDFANTVQDAADALGQQAAVTSLLTGEKSGKHDYENALEDQEVMLECKTLIRSSLLPSIEEHIFTLERFRHAA